LRWARRCEVRIHLRHFAIVGLELKGVGAKFKLDTLKTEDLQNGTWESSWVPRLEHPSIAPENRESASKTMVPGLLLATMEGMFVVGDEWNKLLPDYEFKHAEVFLREAWEGKA
jgi:hypothetical protein